MWFDSLRAFHTTDKRPASHLVSRPYRIGYNALDDCRYRRLVLLVLLCLNSCLPLSGQTFNISFLYSVVKVRFGFLFFEPFSIRFKAKNRLDLHLNHPTKGTKEIVDNLARISPPLRLASEIKEKPRRFGRAIQGKGKEQDI